jgi:hypothetical protein
MVAWPQQSPDSTPLEFTMWGYINDKFFAPTLPNFGRSMVMDNRRGYDHKYAYDS